MCIPCVEIAWNVLVKTRDQVGAGTSARVYIQIYGDKGKSEECHLTSEKVGALEKTHTFNMGAVDRFKATLLDVGTISKLRIWHDNSGFFPGWLLEKACCIFFRSLFWRVSKMNKIDFRIECIFNNQVWENDSTLSFIGSFGAS